MSSNNKCNQFKSARLTSKKKAQKLNEYLRQSNLTLDSLKVIHDKQAVNVEDLKLKLDEIAALKDHLKSNRFVPSLTFKDENDFGVLNSKRIQMQFVPKCYP